MSSLNTQTLENTGAKILPQNQVESNGMTISFSNLDIFNTESAQAYSLQGNLKFSQIQSQSSSSGILTSSNEIVQTFTIANNFNAVHKINSIGIQFDVTNTSSSTSHGFTSALSAFRYLELLSQGATVATIYSINLLAELLYLSTDQLIPICEAMGINYNPETGSFTEGFILAPNEKRTLTIPILCPIINKVFTPCLNSQYSIRIHWSPYTNFVQPKINTTLSESTDSVNIPLPASFTTSAYTVTTGYEVDNFQLNIMGYQFYGETYNRLYNDHLNKPTFSKILVPRASVIPLSQVPTASTSQQTQQLSILSGSFIDLNMWVNASTINSNTSFAAGATATGFYMDGYNYVPGKTDIWPTQLFCAYNNDATGVSGSFPTYLIPNKKSGNTILNSTLLDSSGAPVLSTNQISTEYMDNMGGLINRAPLMSILPIVNYSFDEFLQHRIIQNSFLSFAKCNGLFNIYWTYGPDYFYTGVSGSVNENLNCSLYISAHQCALAALSESGALTIIYV